MEEFLPVRGVRYVRTRALDWVAEVGRVAMLLGDIARFFAPGLRAFGRVVQQMGVIGVGSLWLVLVVSLFTGAVAAVQAAYQFTSVVPMRYLGSVVLRSVIIELSPVLTGLVLAGRVGSSIAAELGTMKVTEQIDALRAMAIHPVRYLVVPRVIAAVFMLPIMTILSDAIAVFGGYVVAITSIGMSSHTFTQSLKDFFLIKDLMSGLIKAFFFGGIIGTMGCYYGLVAEGGAEGVGLATTRAVVAACVLVLISDYVLANILFRFIFPA
jgi:phospholipid/cholesterol/gamma-HCH transport system permease protein